MKYEAERRQIIAVAQALNPLGLNSGSSGNVSCRVQDGLLLTPSGVNYESLKADDIIHMDWNGDWQVGNQTRKPSSEWRMHRDVLQAYPEMNALVHTHANYCTALAVLGKGIPAFHYMVAIAGGNDIRCASYQTFGTQALSDTVVAALVDRKACLLANHGVVAGGKNLDEALALLVEVETLAHQYCTALQIGQPHILSDAEMEKVLEKFKQGYGYGES